MIRKGHAMAPHTGIAITVNAIQAAVKIPLKKLFCTMQFTTPHDILSTTVQLPSNLQKAEITTPWGVVWIAGQGDRLSGWWFENHLHAPALQLGWGVEFPKDRLLKKETINTQVWEKVQDAPFVIRTSQWLDQYMNKAAAALPPLHIYGSPFRLTVWTSLLDIPWGKTWTYTELAKIVHTKLSLQLDPTSIQQSTPHHKSDFRQLFIRSVATAVAHNPLSVLLPCHRVIGSSGNLCGYAGGIERKIALLAHEGAVLL